MSRLYMSNGAMRGKIRWFHHTLSDEYWVYVGLEGVRGTVSRAQFVAGGSCDPPHLTRYPPGRLAALQKNLLQYVVT